MAETWIDAPGSVLPSRYEPLDFTATSDLSFISVSYEGELVPHMEELAYRDGAFRYPYLDSTHVGNAFSLRRRGGWPRPPTVHVQEAAAFASAPWSVIYGVDFAALAAASFATAGLQTIDGLDWYLKGTFTQSGGLIHSSDLDGTGLRLRVNFASEGTDAHTNLRWFLPLANVPGYLAAAPVAIWARVSTSSSNSLSQAIVGLASAAASAASFSVPERQTRIGVGCYGTDTHIMSAWIHNATETIGHTLSSAPSASLYGLQKLSPTTTRRMAGLFSGAPLDPYAAIDGLSSPAGDGVRVHASATANLGVYFACNFNGGSIENFYLHNLYIMQPRQT